VDAVTVLKYLAVWLAVDAVLVAAWCAVIYRRELVAWLARWWPELVGVTIGALLMAC
jgi:hypothetical protein